MSWASWCGKRLPSPAHCTPSNPEFLAEVRRTQGHAGLSAHHMVKSMLAHLELGPMEWPAA